MSTLHLNLIKKWFDMIYIGTKKAEYRTLSPYFCSKFLLVNGDHWTAKEWNRCSWFVFTDNKLWSINLLKRLIDEGDVSFKLFDTVTFSNGMTPPVPRYKIVFEGFDIKEGDPKWGAKEGVKYFVLKLGKIII